MALQVWLPLDGDLENLGLDDIKFTNTTVSGYEDGKIGKALKTLGTNIAFTAPSIEGITQFSVAFWFKSKTNSSITTNWHNVIAINSSNADESTTVEWRFESSYANNYILSAHNNVGDPIMTGTGGLVSEKDRWYHVAATCDGASFVKFYIDGEHINSDRTYLGGHLRSLVKIANESADPDALLNDLRIYDHALSQKEIKLLSQGLVAHYPLNDGVGGENLCTSDVSAWYVWNSNTVLSYTDDSIKATIGSSSYSGIIIPFGNNDALVGGEECTISFEYRTNATSLGTPYIINVSGGNTPYRTVIPIDRSETQWKRFEITLTFPSTKGKTTKGILLSYVKNIWIEIKKNTFKVEKGSKATPWIPNPNDTLYSAMGLDNGVVYDCSGYGHDGSVVGAGVSYSSEAPRYTCSTDFQRSDATNSYINLGTGGKVSDEITVSEWVYMDTWTTDPHPFSCTEGGGWNIEKNSNKPTFSINVNTVGYVHSINGDISTPLWTDLSSGWHMFTGTYDGFNVKLYIDGELVANKATGKTDKLPIHYHATNPIVIHSEATSTTGSNSYPACKMSDMRIYATALSAEDIKSLYETRASIDNYSNTYAYEFMEV